MKHSAKVLLILFSLSIAGSVPALADLIYAEIKSIDQQQNQLTITPRGGSQNLPQEVTLNVRQSVLEMNETAQSLQDFSAGDMIVVEAAPPIVGGDWEAQSILTQEQIQQGQGGDIYASEGPLAGPELQQGEQGQQSPGEPIRVSAPAQGVRNQGDALQAGQEQQMQGQQPAGENPTIGLTPSAQQR